MCYQYVTRYLKKQPDINDTVIFNQAEEGQY